MAKHKKLFDILSDALGQWADKFEMVKDVPDIELESLVTDIASVARARMDGFAEEIETEL